MNLVQNLVVYFIKGTFMYLVEREIIFYCYHANDTILRKINGKFLKTCHKV